MKVQISKSLYDIYEKQHKSFDYAVDKITDGFDPESYLLCIDMVDKFVLDGDKVEISLGEQLVNKLTGSLSITGFDDKTAELLLWLGAIFPEV